MLSQTKQLISERKNIAREIDQTLIRGRVSAVGRSLSLIEGRQHSDKYVRRLAGISPDVYRRSVSERFVEWFGATAAEDKAKASLIGAFLAPLLSYPLRHTIYIHDDFWKLDADISSMLSELRKAVVTANKVKAQFHLCQIKTKVDEAIRAVGEMVTF
jgi:hypothetical protein